MYVTNVALEDIKSYETKTTVHLGEGVTAIIGENGAGKSTIAEAIGFALFDSLPDSVAQKDFVRRGESTGTVWVTFVTQDGETYTVERDAGSNSSRYAVIDEDAGAELELDTKSAVVDWLRATFGIAGSDITLSDLWEHCIGVPQTRFLGDFRKTEANRKDDFDPLLGIDIYEQAWGRSDGPNLKAPVDELKQRKQTAAQRIATLDAQASDLSDAREHVREAEEEVTDREGDLATIYNDLGAARVAYTTLYAQKERIDELQDEHQDAQRSVAEARSEVRSAVEKLAEAREAASIVEETAEAHAEWTQADEALNQLRAQARERNELAAEQSERREAMVEAKSAYSQTVEKASQAREADERMAELQEAYDRYEQLDERIDEAQDRVDRLEEARDRHAELVDDEIPEAEAAVADQEQVIEDLEAKQALADRVDELQDKRDSLVATYKQAQAKVEDLEEQRDRLLDVDVDGDGEGEVAEDHDHDDTTQAACPTCQRPMDEDLRDDVVETIDEQIRKQKQRFNGARKQLDSVKDELEAAKEAQQAVARLPGERDKLDRLEGDLDELETARDELAEEIEDLDGADGRLEELREEQAGLESDHDNYETAQLTYQTNKSAIDEVDSKRAALVDAAHDLALVERKLEAYEGLDDKIDAQEAIKERTAEAHRKYIQHEDLAGKVDNRRAALLDVYDQVETVERERRQVERDLQDARDGFDADEYDRLSAEIDRLKARRAECKTELKNARGDLDTARREVEKLETIAAQRDRWKETHTQLERDIAFAEAVREGVRNAGPKMRELIASRVTERANTIYQQLRGTGRESLTVDATYLITVQDGAQEKPFGTLSGGEKMAAALAVRLAIMEQVSPVGIAVLDEPTANLDTEKKQNLVRQLERLDGFEQLTVVSHDDTFDATTEYTVKLDKPDRETQVVADAQSSGTQAGQPAPTGGDD